VLHEDIHLHCIRRRSASRSQSLREVMERLLRLCRKIAQPD
jgi:hypothetical protein